MTLRQYKTLTGTIPAGMLRPAIAAALVNGVPRTPEEFARFHDHVIDELRLASYGRRERRYRGLSMAGCRSSGATAIIQVSGTDSGLKQTLSSHAW